ncbi:MAG: amino acid ABC transporter substrate-binding protein [Gemmatimonadaceae bacterium]|nr:amino acid ABC transporter substrate-binding protein [Gemmatimonadaceae bacterium]
MKRLLLLLVIPAAGIAAGCSGAGSSSSLSFGAAGPWDQGYGAMNRRGVELAQEEINALPERAGKPLNIVFVNDSGSGQVASAVAQHFVDSDSVLAVVGHVNSGAMVAAAQVYNGRLAAVATTASSPALTGISTWAFRVISSDSTNGIGMAQFAARRQRKRAAILFENNTYGRGLAESFRRGFTGEIISIDPIAEGKAQTFEPYVSFYKQRAPDVVFVAGTDESGLEFLKEVRRQQLNVDLIGGDGWSGLNVDTVRSEGVFAGVPFTSQDPRPEAQRFVQAFRKKFNMSPDHNAALAYDATMLLYQGAKTGRNRAQIRDYLRDLSAESAHKGVTGSIFFKPDGDPASKNVVMTRIEHGVLRVAEGGA